MLCLDFGRYLLLLASRLTMSTQKSCARTPTHSIWGVAVQDSHGVFDLRFVNLQRSSDGEQAIKFIRGCFSIGPVSHLPIEILFKLFCKTIVGTATIKKVRLKLSLCNDVAETIKLFENPSDTAKTPVLLDQYEVDHFLTEALANPRLLRDDNTLLSSYQHLDVPQLCTLQHLAGQRILVLVRRLDKMKAALAIVFLMAVSIPLGIVIGIRSHRIEVGIAVSAGILALGTLLQGVVAWFHV